TSPNEVAKCLAGSRSGSVVSPSRPPLAPRAPGPKGPSHVADSPPPPRRLPLGRPRLLCRRAPRPRRPRRPARTRGPGPHARAPPAPPPRGGRPPAPPPQRGLPGAGAKGGGEVKRGFEGLGGAGSSPGGMGRARRAAAIQEKALGPEDWGTADARRKVETLR